MASHRVLLLNFTKEEAAAVGKAGFNVERGMMGRVNLAVPTCPFNTPHPLYEYDVLVYNSHLTDELLKEFGATARNLFDEKGSLQAVTSFKGPPFVRVAFIGGSSGASELYLGGLPFAKLIRAETNVSSFVEARSEAIDKLHKLIAGFKGQIESVEQFFSAPQSSYPFTHHRVLMSKSFEEVAGYGTAYEGGTVPRYVILPRLVNMSRAVIEILQCLETVYPALFPDKMRLDWINADEFLTLEEMAIKKQIGEIVAEATKAVQDKNAELAAAAAENSFVRNLLTATEDASLEPERRLVATVKRALNFLEFQVEDIDEKTKNAIRKEDLWVRDGGFLAITEVAGTTRQNPKVKEFNDILARMATIYKRKSDLPLPPDAALSGLLILNYDVGTHPSKRPTMYTGEDEHIIDTAIEQNIGLLSTVELHKIIVDVKAGKLTKAAAREILKKFGRIEYQPGAPAFVS
jgi:hypothetical protein